MKRYLPFSRSEIGASHIAVGKPCQDASMHYEDDLMSVVAVADGHGSESYFRSDFGAKVAVTTAIQIVQTFLVDVFNTEDGIEKMINDTEDYQRIFFDSMKNSILATWQNVVRTEAMDNPFSEEELSKVKKKYLLRYENENNVDWAYGTTLIVAVVTERFWFSLHIGDGNCVEYYDGNFFIESTPPDPNCQGEATTSLCQNDAIDNFRHYFSTDIPPVIFLHSDGIDDSLLSDDIRQDEYQTWSAVFVQGMEYGINYITERRIPYIAQNWKKDDTSAAGIIDTENMPNIAKFMYKLRVEGKLKRDYADALTKRESLITSCESLQRTISELEEKSRRAKQEYDFLRGRAQIYTGEKKMLQELIDSNKEFLSRRVDELNACEDAIRRLEEKLQATIQQGNKLVSDNKRDQELITTNKNFLAKRQVELSDVETRLAELTKQMNDRGLLHPDSLPKQEAESTPPVLVDGKMPVTQREETETVETVSAEKESPIEMTGFLQNEEAEEVNTSTADETEQRKNKEL